MVRMTVLALAGLMSFSQKYTGDDLWYLSRVIQSESGYCSREMQEAVGSVVLNRVGDERFPDSTQGQQGELASAV